MKQDGSNQKLQLNELDELCNEAYEKLRFIRPKPNLFMTR